MNSQHSTPHPWIVALTGASGMGYGQKLIELLLKHSSSLELEVVISEAGLRVLREEEGAAASVGKLRLPDFLGTSCPDTWCSRVRVHSNKNIGASIASGSYKTSGMIVVPCSMRTLGAIANGVAENLIHRAADVVLKEGRPLILVPRETPLSSIHLENMLKLSRMNVKMVPAMPGFYNKPQSIEDLVEQFAARLTDQMGFDFQITKQWGKDDKESREVNLQLAGDNFKQRGLNCKVV